MKKIFKLLVLMMIMTVYSACEKELTSEGVSKITHYVTFNLTNGALVFSPKGTVFVDPGIQAMEGTSDVSDKVRISGSVNHNAVGLYVLTYNATNEDGFSASVSRSVIVYDPEAPSIDLTGQYLANVSRISPVRAFSGLNVTITKIAPGIFYISDLLGGFYDQGSNYLYGPDYAMNGYLQLNADNSLSCLGSFCPGFGDSLNNLINGVYDPVTKLITWRAVYTPSNYNYLVSLSLI